MNTPALDKMFVEAVLKEAGYSQSIIYRNHWVKGGEKVVLTGRDLVRLPSEAVLLDFADAPESDVRSFLS